MTLLNKRSSNRRVRGVRKDYFIIKPFKYLDFAQILARSQKMDTKFFSAFFAAAGFFSGLLDIRRDDEDPQ